MIVDKVVDLSSTQSYVRSIVLTDIRVVAHGGAIVLIEFFWGLLGMFSAIESMPAGAIDLIEYGQSFTIEIRQLGVKLFVGRAGVLTGLRANVVDVFEW